MTASPGKSASVGAALLALLGSASSCGGERPIAPAKAEVSLAKHSATGNPTVTSTVPSTGPRNTTLDVTVMGSGFEAGSRAVWALNGDTTFATTRVRTNSSVLVGSTELRANISIAADAPVDLFDVQVILLGGRKGIGIEMFEVTVEILDLGAGDGSSATAVNDAGQIVGNGAAGLGAFIWENGILRSLGVLPGMTGSIAEDINQSGQVVGYSSSNGPPYSSRAFVWTAGNGMQPLNGSLGGCCTVARRINDEGLVLGEARLPGDAGTHAVVWENGVMRDIHTLVGGDTFPWGLGNEGTAVGQWGSPSQGAFRWTSAGDMTLMAGLGGPNDIPLAVGDNGDVVGWHQRTGSNASTAFLWRNGTLQELGTLGGPSSAAIAINAAGEVVGRSDMVAGKGKGRVSSRAFIWTEAAGMKDLGLLSGQTGALAWGLNGTGWVVGQVTLNSGYSRATRWKLR